MRILYTILIALLIAGCSRMEEQTEAIRPVFYFKVGESFHTTQRAFPGVTQPADEARLSFKTGGTVTRLYVDMGDTVKQGECLAQLDSTDYYINYVKAVSALDNAEAQLANALSEFQRMEKLYIKNNISLRDYEQVKTRFESARAMEKSSRLQVQLAQNQLSYTSLKAPFSGVISSVFIRENEMIGAGKPAVVLSSLNNFEVKTIIPENLIGQLKPGMHVDVTLNTSKNTSFSGKVVEIGTTSQNATAFPVIIGLQDADAKIFSGMTTTVTFQFNSIKGVEAEPLIIPEDAVCHDHKGNYVFVAQPAQDEEDVFIVKRKEIVTAGLKPEGYLIGEGLSEGDVVVTAGLRFMYEGRKVRLLNNFNSALEE